MSNHFNRETILAQIGNEKNEANQSVSTPIYLSTAYRHQEIGQTEGYDYTRTGNPTRDVLESQIAKIEKGDAAFACSSGMEIGRASCRERGGTWAGDVGWKEERYVR